MRRTVSRLLQRMLERALTEKELEAILAFWDAEKTDRNYGLSIAEIALCKAERKRSGSVIVKLANNHGTLTIDHKGIEIEGDVERDDNAIRASLEMFRKQWPRGVIKLEGDEDFQLRTWAQAELLGLKVKKFKPTTEQRDRLVTRGTIEVLPRQHDESRSRTRQGQEAEEAERVSLKANVERWYFAKLEGRKFEGPAPSAEELARVRVRFGPLTDRGPERRARPAATVQRALTQ
jgi:Large polyvalent protein-associated domain 7